jgi:outer membrane beta-barrel protein
MTVATAAQAEVVAGSFSFTPFIGGYVFEGNENFSDTNTVGLRAGYNFTASLGVEGFFSYAQTAIQNIPGEPWHNIYGYGIEGIYHFMPLGDFVPFLAVGLGGIHYGYPEPYRFDRFAVDYGAGLKYFLKDNIALRADVRHVIPFNERYNDLLCTFGIEFSFGGEKKEVVALNAEEAVVPVEVIPPKAEEAVTPVEVVPPKAEAPAPVAEVAVAPVVTGNSVQVSNKQNETKTNPEEDIRNLITKWLTSWRSGDMETYRSCYASNFEAKEKNLNGWISYKTNVRQRSKNINISIDDLHISIYVNSATAVFTQSYSSSLLKDSGKKTLELRQVNSEWKIYREIM